MPHWQLSPQDEARRRELEEPLRTHNGHLTQVARALGKDRTQIYRWICQFGLRRSAD